MIITSLSEMEMLMQHHLSKIIGLCANTFRRKAPNMKIWYQYKD